MVHVLLTLFVYMCTCMRMCIDAKYGTCTINVICIYMYVSGGSTGGQGGVRTPPPLMGQHPISTDPTSPTPDLVHHKCKISYLKFLNKLILLI